jgi:hypothetical protein
MASVFWDSEGVIHVDFLPQGVQYYSRPQKLLRIITLLHDNAHSQVTALMKATLERGGLEIKNHPSYSPDLGPSDFHLF